MRPGLSGGEGRESSIGVEHRRMAASHCGEAQYKKRCWSSLQQRFLFGGARFRAYCLLDPRPYILP
ncbi:hypothetical protein PEP31012_04623 [Pandoraea eparura]|uniref:Uncharacterized protein n=1 Tax=Pandoraea eparura TaxID=2508291 RepID=A0A5E4YL61_9BURK|nr:hypothetical protein PEP31012_04623 [Pandoraea eparura]